MSERKPNALKQHKPRNQIYFDITSDEARVFLGRAAHSLN